MTTRPQQPPQLHGTVAASCGRKEGGGGGVNPGDGFWEGVGQSVGSSPGWMVIGAPARHRSALRRGQVRLPGPQGDQDARAGHPRARGRERCPRASRPTRRWPRTCAACARATTRSRSRARRSAAGIEESRARSRGMGDKVDHIDRTTSHTDTLVEDIHRHIIGGEGTD